MERAAREVVKGKVRRDHTTVEGSLLRVNFAFCFPPPLLFPLAFFFLFFEFSPLH